MASITLYHRGAPLLTQRVFQTNLSIGSHPDNDLVISGEGVRERHVVLSRDSRGKWQATAAESGYATSGSVTRFDLGPYALELVEGRQKDPAEDDLGMAGVSPQLRILRSHIRRMAPLRAPVLVSGETGTGKELVARALHSCSGRPPDQLVAINCAALGETMFEDILFGHEKGAFTGASSTHRGVFERASGGTLFLDEIGELPLQQQAALLRVLDTGRVCRLGSELEEAVDFRLVAATNRDLGRMVDENKFRLDLLHRLGALTLSTPPLRDRTADIGPMSLAFLHGMKQELGNLTMDPSALDALATHPWPGNARELRNVIYRAAITAHNGVITEKHFVIEAPERSLRASGFRLDEISDGAILDMVVRHRGNVTRAAREFGIPRSTLRDRMSRIHEVSECQQ